MSEINVDIVAKTTELNLQLIDMMKHIIQVCPDVDAFREGFITGIKHLEAQSKTYNGIFEGFAAMSEENIRLSDKIKALDLRPSWAKFKTEMNQLTRDQITTKLEEGLRLFANPKNDQLAEKITRLEEEIGHTKANNLLLTENLANTEKLLSEATTRNKELLKDAGKSEEVEKRLNTELETMKSDMETSNSRFNTLLAEVEPTKANNLLLTKSLANTKELLSGATTRNEERGYILHRILGEKGQFPWQRRKGKAVAEGGERRAPPKVVLPISFNLFITSNKGSKGSPEA